MERGLLFLADSKTGRKTVILNAPAMAVLADLDRMGTHVVPGDDPGKPRADLKRPWEAVAKRAGLSGVRLHDLRHTYASFGAGGGLGLPIIGIRRHQRRSDMRISMQIRCVGPRRL
jgi:integrase